MYNELISLYVANEYGIVSDRILWTETVPSQSSVEVTLVNAINGSALKSNLSTVDFFLTKYAVWTFNGIVQIDIKPDFETSKIIKTHALTQKTESSLVPPTQIISDISITLTNNQSIDDDVFIVFDVFKIPENNVPELIDTAKGLIIAPDHIDIQTLSIQKYLIYTNELLKALLMAGGNEVPGIPTLGTITSTTDYPAPREEIPKDVTCRRL